MFNSRATAQTKSRTECCTPVAITKSSGRSCCNMSHMHARDYVEAMWLLLQHEPHGLYVIAGMPPVALGIKIAEVQTILKPELYADQGPHDLARDECLSPDRRFVVEENAAASVNPIRLAVASRDPMGVQLGNAVRRSRIKRRSLLLRHLLHFAEHLRRRSLVEPGFLRETEDSNRFQHAQRAKRV